MKCILIIVVSYFLCTFFFKSILFCASWYRLHDQQIFCILFRHFIFYFLQFFFFSCIVHFVDLIVKRLSSWRARLPTRDHFRFLFFINNILKLAFLWSFKVIPNIISSCVRCAILSLKVSFLLGFGI